MQRALMLVITPSAIILSRPIHGEFYSKAYIEAEKILTLDFSYKFIVKAYGIATVPNLMYCLPEISCPHLFTPNRPWRVEHCDLVKRFEGFILSFLKENI